jgi:hypothetical protein
VFLEQPELWAGLLLENRRVMERKHKLVHRQLDMCYVRLSHSFSQGRRQLDKDSLPRSVKGFSAPTTSRLLLLGIRVFKEPKLPKTRNKLIVGAITVVSRDITLIDAPIYALVSVSLL